LTAVAKDRLRALIGNGVARSRCPSLLVGVAMPERIVLPVCEPKAFADEAGDFPLFLRSRFHLSHRSPRLEAANSFPTLPQFIDGAMRPIRRCESTKSAPTRDLSGTRRRVDFDDSHVGFWHLAVLSRAAQRRQLLTQKTSRLRYPSSIPLLAFRSCGP
jgi:hypothetical protein